MTARGHLEVVPGIVGQGGSEAGDQAAAFFSEDRASETLLLEPVAVREPDLDVLQRVADVADEIARQLAGESDAGTGLTLIVVVGEEVQVAVIQVDAQGEPFAQEPGLDKGRDVILATGTHLGPQTGLLTRTREIGRIRDVKISLTDFDEADHRVHRTETGAESDVAGVLFLDRDDEVFSVGNVGRFWLGLYLLEELHLFEAALGHLGPHHVEGLARRDGQFATDDLVLGLGVALDLDLLDVELVALLDAVLQVESAFLDIGDLLGLGAGFDVAPGPIEILDGLGVLVETLRRKDLALLQLKTSLGLFTIL